MDKSAQFQTPAQNILFIDLTVDSLGCFYKNIGLRQNKYSQWIYLLTYHLEITILTDFRHFIWVWMTSKGHSRWEKLFLYFTGWSSGIYILLVIRPSCCDLSYLSWLNYLKSLQWFFFLNGNYAISVSLITIQLKSLRETLSNLISFKVPELHKALKDSEAILVMTTYCLSIICAYRQVKGLLVFL